MTKDEFRRIEKKKGFRDACVQLVGETDEITFEEVLKMFIKQKTDEDSFLLVKHLAEALVEVSPTGLWRYDYCMGTLDTPTPIVDFDDIEDLLED